MRKDPVSPQLRGEVLIADGFACVAPRLAPTDDCAGRLTLDHVKTHPMLGKRAPSDRAHLVTLCWHHHLDGWATAHRPALREYLREREGGHGAGS